LLLAAVLLVTLPVVGGALRAVSDGWTPVGDDAVIQIRTFDVGTSRTPLVGISSTVSLDRSEASNHPGPIQLWLLAPVLRTISAVTDSPSSIALAQALLNLLVLLGTVGLLAWSAISTTRFVVSIALLGAGLWLAGPAVAFSPWNPDPAFVALLCAATLAWTTGDIEGDIEGDRTRLAWLAAVSSIAAQSHLAYTAPAITLLAVAWVTTLRRPSRSRWFLSAPALITLLLMWSGPIVDVFDGGGNVRRFLAGGGAGAGRFGLGRAWQRLTDAVLPWRLGLRRAVGPGDLLHVPAVWEQLAAAVLVALLVWCAVRGHRRRPAVLVSISLFVLFAATAMMPPSLGAFLGAHVYRVWIPMVLVWWATLLAEAVRRHRLGRAAAPTLGLPTRLRWPAAVVAVAAAAVAFLAGPVSDVHPLAACSAATRTLVKPVPPLEGPWVLDSSAVPLDVPVFESQVAAGVWAELVRRGADVRLLGRTQPAAYHPGRLVSTVPSGAGVMVLTTSLEPVSGAALLASVEGDKGCEQPGEGTTLSLWLVDSTG
jgi:hypothetical protein